MFTPLFPEILSTVLQNLHNAFLRIIKKIIKTL